MPGKMLQGPMVWRVATPPIPRVLAFLRRLSGRRMFGEKLLTKLQSWWLARRDSAVGIRNKVGRRGGIDDKAKLLPWQMVLPFRRWVLPPLGGPSGRD
jgi:hypothetical protein